MVEADVARAGALLVGAAQPLGAAVRGIYLVGSVALGDYLPGVSDVDFVVVVDDPAVLTLRSVQRFADSRFERNIVTWHILARCGVAVSGPEASDLGVWTDREVLMERTRDNLATYWAGWLAARRSMASSAGATLLLGSQVTWGVLGATRLRHTLAVGDVTTKTDAAVFGVARFGTCWERILQEALRLRVGGAARYRNPAQRRHEALAYLDHVLRDGVDEMATGNGML